MAAEVLSPFVFWGQNSEYIFLKVDLRDSETPEVNLDEDSLKFRANGVGGRGRNDYSFDLEFYLPIDQEESQFRVTERNIEFQIQKAGVDEVWPRLTVDQRKPEWLKIDFDKFVMDDDSEEEAKRTEQETKSKEEELWKNLSKDLEETKDEATADLKSLWLVVYNLFQWIGYTYVFVVLFYKYLKEGTESKVHAVENVGSQLMVCQLAAILEIIHPLVGVVKTGVASPLMQVFGRALVLFIVIAPEEQLHSSEWVWWLFLTWSSVEVIRYPFYMLSSMQTEVSMVTWLRYNLWIPLYPLGFFFESMVILQALPLYELSGRWSLELPNSYNMAFPFPYFLRAYLILFLMGGYVLLKRMYLQRQKKMASSSKRKTKVS